MINPTDLELLEVEKRYLSLWDAKPDGMPIRTATGYLRPVLYKDNPAMLKIITDVSELNSVNLLRYFNGKGAVLLLESHSNVLLMEKAMGKDNLLSLVRAGDDDRATKIICSVVQQLHTEKGYTAPHVPTLEERFYALHSVINQNPQPLLAKLLGKAVVIANDLLISQTDTVVLHGDIHHENVLYDDHRGWLAIDPKGLIGDRTYDYANTLCNPRAMEDIAHDSKRFGRQRDIMCDEAGLDKERLTSFTFVHACLSAAWAHQDQNEHSMTFGLKMAETIEQAQC